MVLAGGRGRRIGQPKALLPYGGGTFLSTIVERLESLDFAWLGVVLPVELEDLRLGPRIHRIINPRPDDGQLSSLRLGLNQGAQLCPWMLVALVDQPAVAPSTYLALTRAAQTREGHLWVPSHGGRRGHPVVFGQAMYGDLLAAPLDQGARWAVSRHRERRQEVPVDDPEVLLDVDTPEDLRRLG